MKPAGYKLTKIDPTRYRASRGPRHAYLTLIDGRWRQTTRDGHPIEDGQRAGAQLTKSLPPRDLERIVAAIEGEAS